MSDATDKLKNLLPLVLAFFLCCGISAAILIFTMFFTYAAWHCNPQPCRPVPGWMNATLLILLLSHFIVFGAGAYFTRNLVRRIARSKPAQTSIMLFFALFPLIIAAAFAGFLAFEIWQDK